MATVLGLNWGHDAAAAIIKDDKLVCAISNERLSRKKKAHGVTSEMIAYVLDEAKLKQQEIDFVGFAAYLYSPDNFARVFQQDGTEVQNHLVHLFGGETSKSCVVGIGNQRLKAFFIQHHIAHCASAYYTSHFDKSACFSVDASMFHPEACSLTASGQGNTLTYFYCPGVMIGNAYSVFTEKLGLGPGLTKAGTMMGLAAYGSPSELVKNKHEEFGRTFYERHFQSDPIFIEHLWTQMTSLPPSVVFERSQSDSKSAMDIAASMQYLFEKTLIKQAQKLFEESKSWNGGNLCLSGGSFLNSDVNMAIARETAFSSVHLFPGCGDDGTAVGSALFVTHQLLKRPRARYEARESMYLGRAYEVPSSVGFSTQPYDVNVIAEALSQGKIVAWFQGRSEFGPRALGNRSIISDPRKKEMQDLINSKIKRREWYRPFAPAVLEEKASEWFEIDFSSKFMLFIAKVREPERLGAVSHVDGTARLQTVSEQDNPRFYELIKAFGEKTGVPIVLNTSLNVNNEPLVETPQDALKFFAETPVDILVMNDVAIFR